MAGARASTRHHRNRVNSDVIFDHNLSDNTIRGIGEGCYDTTPDPAKAKVSTPLTSYEYQRVSFYISSYKIKSHQFFIIFMSEFRCLVGMVELLVGCLGGSFMQVDLSMEVKENRVTSGFGLQVMLGEQIYD